MTRHLVTLGGGGFSMEPSPNALDDYLLRLTRKRKPRVCFLGTASGDAVSYAEKFTAAFPKGRAVASVCRLFDRDGTDVAAQLLAQDLIYVGGGNTANLLAVWRLHGVDRALRRAWKQGVVLAGISAGMNCWHAACSTDSFGPLAPLNDGLGLVPLAACPHFDGEAERRPTLLKWVASGKLPTTHAADNFAVFHYTAEGTALTPKLHRCIKSKLEVGCYRIEKRGGKAVVESLPTDMIG